VQNAMILDMDGNGWSNRFMRMSHFSTPIMKQVCTQHGELAACATHHCTEAG
jgi:hypothetical protein